MANTTTYIFQCGEPIELSLDATSGDAGDVGTVTAKMKRAIGGDDEVDFTVTPRAADGDVPAGWDLVGDSTGLPAGLYRVDAKLPIADTFRITAPVMVQLDESAIGGA